MLNQKTRTWLVAGVWLATLAAIITLSAALGASLSTGLVLLVLGVTPLGVMLMLAAGAASPTVAELLHSVDATDRR